MKNELAYALITPYSILKSRTGGIISRLIAHAKLRLMAVRTFVFSDEFVNSYLDVLTPAGMEPATAQAWRNYIDENFRLDNPSGALPRCMLLLFEGPGAAKHLKQDVIGSFTEEPTGNTIRGTYGDFLRGANGTIRYFEPAVMTAPSPERNVEHLRLFARFSDRDGGILTGRCKYPPDADVQTSLVILKPDNFDHPTRKPGNIIDVFSRTGLRIVGTKLFRMTVSQAEEFYGPLKELFLTKLKPNLAGAIHSRLKDAFSFTFDESDAEHLADRLARRHAVAEFNKIVEYMTGVNPSEITDPREKLTAGRSTCLAMLYEGHDAIAKIRHHLGSTDPTKAEPGTVRSDFGRDLMRNGTHASDSVASARRERKIIGMWEETGQSDVSAIITAYLNSVGEAGTGAGSW